MNSYTKVLLSTDFSEAASTLPDCLFALCPDIETEVILVHFLVEDEPDTNARLQLENLVAKLRQACYENVTVSTPQLKGEVFQDIHEMALNNGCDLVLVASHDKGLLRTTFMGSVTLDLARVSNYPLFIGSIYNENHSCPLLNKILIATDFSKESLVALDFIRALHEYVEEVVFIHVVEQNRSSEELEHKMTLGRQKLSELVEEVKIFGVKSSYVIEKGSASKKIRKVSDELNVSLVIMAKTGSGMVKGLPFGSTFQNFALNTDRPLLLLPSIRDDD